MNTFDHLSGEHLEIDGAKIYYEVRGNREGPTLLFLHGGLGTIEDFNSILPDLSGDFRVVGIDSRGHGKSTLGSGDLTYERIQKDVLRVLEHLGIDAVSIIGFSDGGIVAYRLAALTSPRVEKLVTIGGDWRLPEGPTREILSQVTGGSWRAEFPEAHEVYRQHNPEPDFDAFVQSVVKMWLDPGASGYPNEAVRNISCPLLIVRGDDDHLVPLKGDVELRGMIEGSKLLNIPFAGHSAFEDQKDIFLMSLRQFLD
ncbi:MAG TPA: alpha/beta hydrolase [Thermoanaerobaculia bacterium]|nr:alpha/beta hydrolase [Thermoanaerobaculia bacterium]